MNRKNRRRAARSFSNVPLDVYDPAGRMIIGEGRFVNVSMTGSLLESCLSLNSHQHIPLHVKTPGTSAFEFAGRVVWRKKKAGGFNYGIAFEPISAAHFLAKPPAYSHAALHRT